MVLYPQSTAQAIPPFGQRMRPAPRPAPFRPPVPVERSTFQKKLVYTLWFILLFDPQFLLQSIGLAPAVRVPLMLAVLLAVSFLGKLPKGDWLWGIFAFVAATAANLPFSYNRGMSMGPFRALILYYIVGLGVVRLVRTPRAAAPILFLLCVLQYFWWGAFGIKSGLVSWHPNLANFDGYGPLMAIGVGPAYFYANSTTRPWLRRFSFMVAGLCVVGVVSAFARGSVLALVATMGYMWLRSPNKAKMAGMGVAAAVLVAIAASLIDGSTRGDDTQSNFWTEMGTMFDHQEGTTGDDRKNLWQAATIVFLNHPIMGVGAENFGAAAVTMISEGQIGGAFSPYAQNPGTLYGRALHSNYYQILSEYGLVGVTIFICILVQFWKRSQSLMTPEAGARWRAGGGTTDLRNLALGIESGMISFLISGVFFNQIFTFWFYSLLIANALLYSIVTQHGALPRPGARMRPQLGRKPPVTVPGTPAIAG
jgi:O-antigen ligase